MQGFRGGSPLPSGADIAELAGGGRSSEDSDDIAFYDKQDGNED
ncbi:hypothetical protein [Ruminococcus sp.]|nr:hypothetical protein [Ruminococcus sp.]